jgi:hypothetical protein
MVANMWLLRPLLGVILFTATTALAADPSPEVGAKSPDAPQPPITGPEADAVDGLPVLKQLVEGGRLRLSADESGATTTFYFALFAYVRGPQGASPSTEVAVWRDGDHLLVWTGSRQDKKPPLPTCAMTDGLFVGLDPKNPGGLVLIDGGHPEVVFSGSQDKKGIDFVVGYRRSGLDSAHIVFDGKAILQSSFSTMTSASYDEKNKTVTVTTKRAKMQLKPAADAKLPCAVEWMTVTGPTQAVAMRMAQEPLKPPPRLEKFTAAAVEASGLPLRRLGSDDPESELRPYFDVPVADFYADPRHRQAAEKLWMILRPPPAGAKPQEPGKFQKTLPF